MSRLSVPLILLLTAIGLGVVTALTSDVAWVESPLAFYGMAALLVAYILYMIVRKYRHRSLETVESDTEL